MSEDRVDPTNLTLTQEAELNAKAASLESFDQKMAFETYYKMGSQRSFAKTAKQIGRSVKTIEVWASQYRWSARVKERERQAAEYLLMQRSAEEEAKVKEKHLTLIDATVAQWSKKLLEGQIKLRSVEDLERLVRLRWDITNLPEKRANPSAIGSGGGGMIDLRLRNMDREELQKFLHGTMASISRIMNKKPLVAPSQGPEPMDDEKINLDLWVEIGEAAPQTRHAQSSVIDAEVVHVGEVDFGNDFDDLQDLEIPNVTDVED